MSLLCFGGLAAGAPLALGGESANRIAERMCAVNGLARLFSGNSQARPEAGIWESKWVVPKEGFEPTHP